MMTPGTVTSWSGDSDGHRTAVARRMSSSGGTTQTTQTTRTKTNGDKTDLKAQLNALKLSLLSDGLSTPGHATQASHAAHSSMSKVSHVGRTSTATSLSGYLQAHRPRATSERDTATAEVMISSSEEEEEEEEADVLDGQLEMTRNRIQRAKTLLRRSDRHA